MHLVCILFVIILGRFQDHCLNFLHFQQKIKPSTNLMWGKKEEKGNAQEAALNCMYKLLSKPTSQ